VAKAQSAKGNNLTLKQEAFCQAYIETGNASEAYRRSYATSSKNEATVWRSAHELLQNPKVAARVREIASLHAQRHEITVDSLTEMLRESYDLAKEVQSPAAAVAAVNALGKLHGLIVERKQVKGEHNHQHHHEHEAVSETAQWIEGVLGNGTGRAPQKPLPN
jgi:phage terminase small subunit